MAMIQFYFMIFRLVRKLLGYISDYMQSHKVSNILLVHFNMFMQVHDFGTFKHSNMTIFVNLIG